jgi:DNA-binding winged helix-turn-helix (wHTH) protein
MGCCPTCGQGLPETGFLLDVSANRLLIDGRLIVLRPMEAAILKVLFDGMAVAESVRTERVLTAIYGSTGIPDTGDASLRVTIHHLRKRLASTRLRLVNHPGKGYSLHFAPAGQDIEGRAA